MHDINWIIKNQAQFLSAMAKRKAVVDLQQLLDLDVKRKTAIHSLQTLQSQRNEKSKNIGAIKDKNSQEFTAAKEEVQTINEQMELAKQHEVQTQQQFTDVLSGVPNILSEDVPDGDSEDANIVIDQYGVIPKFNFHPKQHFELGEKLKLMDFEQTAVISGSRFVTLFGLLARLERALANFMLDIHTKEFGFLETNPALLVKTNAMYGAGQLPKFANDSFQTQDGHWLIPTSEVSLTNLVAEKIIDTKDLPLRFTALTPCFRSEAGSAGKDTRGMVRLHQFNKVELVTICSHEQYESEFAHLLKAAQTILDRLELPYQKILKCGWDTGFGSAKTYDLEVWLPGQNCYREISSCSVFGQFQGRRMNARYKGAADKETAFLYTMNGSGLAVGRTLIAVLENYQQEDGTLAIPDALKSYMI